MAVERLGNTDAGGHINGHISPVSRQVCRSFVYLSLLATSEHQCQWKVAISHYVEGVIGINIFVWDCPAIATKWHVGDITAEELEGIENCSFAVEPRTVSTSSIRSLKLSESVCVELHMGQYGSGTPGKHRGRRGHKWSYLHKLKRSHRETW